MIFPALVAFGLLGGLLYRAQTRRESLRTPTLPQTASAVRPLYGGRRVPVSMNGLVPQTTIGPPRGYVSINPDAPDARIGSFWRGVAHHNWDQWQELAMVEPPTIVGGVMMAKAYALPPEYQ